MSNHAVNSIGIFDSGWGGISILARLKPLFPKVHFTYVADHAFIPYGTKSDAILQDRASRITQFFKNIHISTIIIACNTATVSTISYLRQHFPHLQFIGIEPAVKPAFKNHQHHVFVFATTTTLMSYRLQHLLQNFATKPVCLKDFPLWVTLAESGETTSPQVLDTIAADIINTGVQPHDSIVLACTHYLFFTHAIKRSMPKVNIFDPVSGIINRLHTVLKDHPISSSPTPITVYSTNLNTTAHQRLSNLLPLPYILKSIHL
jgi:glutamate racemase